jgi:DNA mismatch repair protein MutS
MVAADKSYGIHVAKIAGMPHQVIERAYKILSRLEKMPLNLQNMPKVRRLNFLCCR